MRLHACWLVLLLAGTPWALGAQEPPPRYLNLTYQRLLPGHLGAYQTELTGIAKLYRDAQLEAYWIELNSITGPTTVLCLNPFDDYDEMQQAYANVAGVAATHPDWVPLQDHLLQEHVASEDDWIAARRDGLGRNAVSISLQKAAVLRITVVTVRPGQAAAFTEALRKAGVPPSGPAYVVYQVEAGGTSPTFIFLTAFPSLADAGAEGVETTLESAAGNNVDSIETHLLVVNAAASHFKP